MISDRKLEHLLICENYDVEFKNKTTGFEDIELIHNVLPEIDKNEIDFEGRYGWIPLSEKIKAEKIPDIIPVSGVISKKYSEKEKHLGVDFAAKNEDPIYASASGIVISVNETEDLGLTIKIDHQNGYITSYSHLGKASVKQGKKVEKGDLIGIVGSTGKTTGPHLHYVIQKDGKYINPETFFNY